MAQSSHRPIPPFLSTLIDKGRRKVFGNKSTPGDLQSNMNDFLSSPPTPSQKKFKKSDDARHDIKVLAMTYILQDNPKIQDLIRVIVGLNDFNGTDGKLSEILTASATFTIQLVSFHEEDSSTSIIAIKAFLTTMQAIDTMVRDGIETPDYMNHIMNDSITQLKSTNPSLGHRRRNIDSDKRLAGVFDMIIGTTSTILNIFNQASDAIPVPFVKPLVASVACLLMAVQQTRSNVDDMRQVATVAGEFVVTLAVVCAGDEMKPLLSFQHSLDKLQKKLHDIAQQCAELSRHNVLWRFFQQGVDKNSLSAIKQDLQNAVVQFQTEAQLLHHLDLRFVGQVVNGKLDEDAVNALPKPPSYVGRRDEYLPGSRSDDIKFVADWLENSDSIAFWMRGGAGLGKSTLAHKIVDSLRADGRLATFVFLLRGSFSDPATTIQTMAKELCALHPRAIPQVAVAARTCNSSHLPLHEYIESYIIKPIRSLSYPYPLVIVMDGLDEWEHYEAFIAELEYIQPPSLVKILLISRPYYSIERSLLRVPVQKYELPPVSQAITEAYFNHHFEKIDWKMRKPSSFTISELARLADGLLIWAAVVCSFLSYEMRAAAPHELVDQILSSGERIALEGQLGNLYHDALKQLFQQHNEQILFRQVFGAMTVLQESLPVPDFARLLGLSDDQVMGVQSRLTALQTRGTFDEHTVSPASQRFHSSFLEFTIDRGTEANITSTLYLINLRIAHESIAEGCLSFLHVFFSSFRGSRCSHSELRSLELYAVVFWPLHLANSNNRSMSLAPKLEPLLLEMSDIHLRQWGAWFLAISLPASSEDWDQVVGDVDTDGFYCSLATFLEDHMKTDTTLAPRITFCLEVAVRLLPKRKKAWQDLGKSYQTRFESTNTLDLLNNAIVVYRRALELCSKDGGDLIMSELGYALWTRFARTGSMCDLEEAISMHRESLSLRPASHPDHSISLTQLANALMDRFKRTGSMSDLEEGILLHREALSLCSPPHPDHPISLNNLANALQNRFGKTGSVADLDEAISMHRESLSLCPAFHPGPGRSMSLNNLAIALQDRFGLKTGSIVDLDEAISLHRESLSFHPAPHPDRAMALNNLAVALRNRSEKSGSMNDLEEAILMHRESLFLRPAPHPDRLASLNNLALALQYRFRRTGSIVNLEEAIPMLRESISLCSAPHPYHPVVTSNLASALTLRFEENGKQSDHDEAMSLRQEVLAIIL